MSNSATVTAADQEREIKKCALSVLWFVHNYCHVEDVQGARDWVPFRLWPSQAEVLRALINNRLVIVLKARQLGMTWIMLAYALWLLLYRAQATVLLFSRRDDEAKELLRRLKGMFDRLPEWMKTQAQARPDGPRIATDNEHVFELGNGSAARAFPATAGDSYTATFVLMDEADLVPDLQRLMGAVKPTIDNGGQLALVSRVDKKRPNTLFKAIYRAAKDRANSYRAIFLPWTARPGRDRAWYDAQVQDSLANTGGLDYVWEQYPETDAQALAPEQKGKRLPADWLVRCYQELKPIPLILLPSGAPLIPGLEVYKLPESGAEYVIGVDTAEGNPTSDDSAAVVFHADTGEEVAALVGKFEPGTFGGYIDALGVWYNRAPVLVERNNHGHAVLLWLKDNSKLTRLRGFDRKPGWLTNGRGKALLYADFAQDLKTGAVTLHAPGTFTQLGSIEGSTLSAPPGDHDDRAVAAVLANEARALAVAQTARRGRGPSGLGGYRG